ncbi:MAG TPA: hypothetical protein VGW38_00715 [Chloroflexota bacterium]|nr:hypothetical protein [Chloroflexota bacterium]
MPARRRQGIAVAFSCPSLMLTPAASEATAVRRDMDDLVRVVDDAVERLPPEDFTALHALLKHTQASQAIGSDTFDSHGKEMP